MADAQGTGLMKGFIFMKALIAKYGVERTAELRTLADRLVVEQGVFKSWGDAVNGIEEQMGLPITVRPSDEVAAHVYDHPLGDRRSGGTSGA